MYNYINGKVVFIDPKYIVLDNNGIGYEIYVANPYVFELEKDYKIYIYNQIREDASVLYGFKYIEERDFFLKLINVKGLGPKMALPMLASGSVSGIIDAIDRENIIYLTKFPKIGEKIARQIILDLKGKLTIATTSEEQQSYEEIISVLENLGYKNQDIKRVIKEIDPSMKIEDQIKDALKLMLRK